MGCVSWGAKLRFRRLRVCGTVSELHAAFFLSGGWSFCGPDRVLSAGLELSPELGCLLMRLSLGVCASEWVRTGDSVGYVWDASIRGGVVWKRERTLRVSDRTDSRVSFVGAWSSSGRKGPPGWQRGGCRAFWILSLVSRRFGAWGGKSGGPFLAGSSVPLSGHMGESWAGILAYGGPERRSAIGLGLGSLSVSAGTPGSVGGGGWEHGLWSPGKAVEDVEPPGRRDLTVLEKVFFPCSRPPESHWELELDRSPPRRGWGGRGGAEGLRGGPSLASPSPDGGCGKLGEGMPGPFVLALPMAGRPSPPSLWFCASFLMATWVSALGLCP